MDRNEAIEYFAFIKSDPDLRKMFQTMVRNEVAIIMRAEVVPLATIEEVNKKKNVHTIPKGCWSLAKAVRMTGYSKYSIYHGISRGYYDGGNGVVVAAQVIEHVMKNAPLKLRATLTNNLAREAKQTPTAKTTNALQESLFAE